MPLNQDLPTILVVEDDYATQSLIEDVLTEAGFNPAIAPSGEEAVTLLQAQRDKYNALVTDINLRGKIQGWEVARLARQIHSDFPASTSAGRAAETGRPK